MPDQVVPKLTVGEVVVVAGRYGSFTWPQTLGVEPPRVVWQFNIADASKILAGPREVTITMTDATGATKKIQRVYVVGEGESQDALMRTVIFSDVRYYLPFGWVRSEYNRWVGSGTLRQVQPDALPQNAGPLAVQNLIYNPSSLKGSDDGYGGRPFNADEIALDVIDKARKGHDFPEIAFRNLARPRKSFTPYNITVDMTGEMAVAQILGALGGLDVRVADDGALELVNAYLGAEKATVDPIVAAYSLEYKGVLRWISMANVAPSGGKILLTRLCEVRAESWETSPDNRALEGDDITWGVFNSPTLINVLKVTDVLLPGAGGVPGAVQGTLLPVDQWIGLVQVLNDQPSGAPAISRELLLAGQGGSGVVGNVSFILAGKMWKFYTFGPDINPGAGPNTVWSARLGEIKNGIRKVYKLNPVFARTCRPGSIVAERAGLLDAANATRQPATLFMDYVERARNRGVASATEFGYNVNAIPGPANSKNYPNGIKRYSDGSDYDVNPFPIAGVTPAPFAVAVADSTVGVFHFAPRLQDTSRLMHDAEFFPGLVWRSPSVDSDGFQISDAISHWEFSQMLLTHRLSLVFSAIPGGPNNSAAFQVYRVSVADALARLGAPADAVTARAPVREMRIREGVALARIPWDDATRQKTLSCFLKDPRGGYSDPSTLLPVNDPELRDFATSVFATHMAAMLDHYEGAMTIGFSPEVMPVGSLTQVQHTFTADGSVYTTLRASGATSPPPPDSLMSQSSRNILFGNL